MLKILYSKDNLQIFNKDGEIDFNLNTDIDVKEVRNLLNKAVTDLSYQNNSIHYWLMQISERNTLSNNLFSDLCYIRLISKYLRDQGNIEVCTNNISIFLYFKAVSTVSFNSRLIFFYKSILAKLKPFKHLIAFILNSIIFYCLYVRKINAIGLKNTLIIETYAGASNFKGEKFKDGYYANLAELLRVKKNKKVLTWISFDKRPFLLSLFLRNRSLNNHTKNSFSSSMEYIRKNQDQFIVMEDYLKLNDYLMAIIHFFKKRFFKIQSTNLSDHKLRKVFSHYLKREHVEYASLFYFFTKRLKSQGSRALTFLISFENLHNQKAIMLGVKENLSDSKVIGSFHTSKPDNLLSLEFASDKKLELIPKPDLIVFNSSTYLDTYRKYNIPSINGYAFRQEFLKNITFDKNSFDEETLLVLFSGDSQELVWQVPLLREIPREFRILVKFHPFYHFDLDDIWNNEDYEVIKNESLSKVLSRKPKILSTYSMLALECATLGLDVGLVYNKGRLIFNPFDSTNINNYSLISNEEEMKNFLIKERQDSQPQTEFFNLSEVNKESLLDCF